MSRTVREVELGSRRLTPADYRAVVYADAAVAIAPNAPVDRYRKMLERRLASGATIYSINSGTGADAHRRIPLDKSAATQSTMLRAFSVQVGGFAPPEVVRGTMLIQAQAYAQGFPGMRRVILERLVWMLNGRIHPRVPLQGSQSASDLVPAAHIGRALIGEGDVDTPDGVVAAQEAGLHPMVLHVKDGGIANTNAFSTALAFDVLCRTRHLLERAELVAAMTLQVLRGHTDAFDPDLISLRSHPGAIESAAAMRTHLNGGRLVNGDARPHDPFSIRCIPQVHGAIRDALSYAQRAVDIELGSVTDNPVVLADGRTLSGGNFHGEPLGLPLDLISIAVAELASLSQRRCAFLVSGGARTGLPPGLSTTEDGWGLVALPTVAAALASECASYARPVSTDSMPVDAMEDHMSMAALAATKAEKARHVAAQVVAVELACAARGLDLLRPLRASSPVEELHAQVRSVVPHACDDQSLDLRPLLTLLSLTPGSQNDAR